MAEIDRHTQLDQLPELLRVPEAAAWADVSRGCIYEAIHRGQLPSIRLGRLVRIPRSALAEMVGRKGNGDA